MYPEISIKRIKKTDYQLRYSQSKNYQSRLYVCTSQFRLHGKRLQRHLPQESKQDTETGRRSPTEQVYNRCQHIRHYRKKIEVKPKPYLYYINI